jgi:hypothetical protein
MQVNRAAIQELQKAAEAAAKEGKIIPFRKATIHEPGPEIMEYWEKVEGEPTLGLRGPLPSVIPVSPEDREQHQASMEAARRRRLEKEFGPMEVPAKFQGLSPWTMIEQYGKTIKRGKTDAIKAAAAWAGVELKETEEESVVGEPTSAKPGLLLYGEPGTGKSGLAWWAVQARGWGLWITWPDLIDKIQSDWDGREALVRAAQEAPVLFLDDLGDPWSTNGRVTDDRRKVAFRIINHRLANQLPTIITSNINGGNLDVVLVNLEQQFDERIVDRLFELCEFVEMGGANLRRAAKKGA